MKVLRINNTLKTL